MTITPGSGLVINVSYDTSVASAPSGFRAAVDAAVTYLESNFTNPITLTISVGYGEIAGAAISAGALAQSTSHGVNVSYAQLAAALPGLSATNPTGNGVFYLADAQAKALGLAGDGGALDGSIGLSSSSNFTFDPNNRAVSGAYDAIGAIEHEITEVMGRVSDIGVTASRRQSIYTPLDLFRYAAPAQRLLTYGIGYFSNDGVTLQTQFNNPSNGNDGGDWASAVQGDAFGDSYSGQVGQITATDLAVMAALGYSTVPAPITGPFATITGLGGAILYVQADTSANAAIAQSVLAPLNTAILAGTLVPALAGATPTVAAGKTGLLQAGSGGQYAIGAGYSAFVGTATVPITVFGGSSAGQRVVAGSGGLAFNAGLGAGTVVAAGGNNLISVLQGAAAQYITTGSGNDTISVLTGSNTINAGTGINLILAQGGNDLINSTGTDLISAPDGNATINAGTNAPTIFLGSGNSRFTGGAGNATIVVGSAAATLTSAGADQLWMQVGGGVVNSSGADTIIGGSGAVTVNAGAGNDFVFAGSGALKVNGGTGASTILGVAGGNASIVGGAGSIIAIAYGATNFQGGAGAATVAAFGGSVTVNGGIGGGVFLGGPAGNNRLSSGGDRTTLIGGGDGDFLTGHAAGGDVFQAGAGAETINAAGASASNKFYGGSGADYMILGAGGDQVLAGTGSATIWTGVGADLIAFTNGRHPSVTFQTFTVAPGINPRDYIALVGFAPGEAARALATATISNGSENLVLSDGTKIQFLGFSGLTSSNFL